MWNRFPPTKLKGVISIRLWLISLWRKVRNILGDSLWWGFHEFQEQRPDSLQSQTSSSSLSWQGDEYQTPGSLGVCILFSDCFPYFTPIDFPFHSRGKKHKAEAKNASSILYQLYFFWPDHLGKQDEAPKRVCVCGVCACVCTQQLCVCMLGSGKCSHACHLRASKYLCTWVHACACTHSCIGVSMCGLCAYVIIFVCENLRIHI